MNGRRNGSLQQRHKSFRALGNVDDVGLRLAVELYEHGRLSVHESGIADVLLAIDHRGHVGEPHGRSVAIGYDQPGIVLGQE